jgi:hypothetical protein
LPRKCGLSLAIGTILSGFTALGLPYWPRNDGVSEQSIYFEKNMTIFDVGIFDLYGRYEKQRYYILGYSVKSLKIPKR